MKIFEQRKKLEGLAAQDSKFFTMKVKELATEVEKLKEFGSRMLKDSALELLKQCRDATTFNTKFVADLNER